MLIIKWLTRLWRFTVASAVRAESRIIAHAAHMNATTGAASQVEHLISTMSVALSAGIVDPLEFSCLPEVARFPWGNGLNTLMIGGWGQLVRR